MEVACLGRGGVGLVEEKAKAQSSGAQGQDAPQEAWPWTRASDPSRLQRPTSAEPSPAATGALAGPSLALSSASAPQASRACTVRQVGAPREGPPEDGGGGSQAPAGLPGLWPPWEGSCGEG